ncbi:radical SAM protein [Natranaerobius thermophilus]|uniref:Radical SAM domain protein n=1 Tax=Natranaerobius thermophilus (strain ATCC BAA-1301 / DSM 18059 / JW/NM-WN-LF) TaxID=457570 RepID=B2A2R0_NATTJ|nr:radical SAM protein [Natranaerobius thermophilus]ACB86278.1 Radical SAM domain protein [Natranaerobius thermophilus JW/NM-WN-LF]
MTKHNWQTKIFDREIGPIRPPNEFDSLLIRVIRNCPWNRCAFCPLYGQEKFSKRELQDILREIDEISRAITKIIDISKNLETESYRNFKYRGNPQLGSKISQETVRELYYKDRELSRIAFWLYWGGKKVFLQDADALVIPPEELQVILNHIKYKLPTVTEVTAYSKGRTLAKRSLDTLQKLRENGLSRIHMGLETGSDTVLNMVNKGVTKAEQKQGAKKAVQAGFTLTQYVLLGLGGREYSSEHAKETSQVINAASPSFVRMRTLSISPNTELHDLVQQGKLTPLNDDEIVQEKREIIKNIDTSSFLTCDHRLNLLENLKGQLPEDKEKLLLKIDAYLKLNKEERQNFQLGRRLGFYKQFKDMERDSLYDKVKSIQNKLKQDGISIESVVEQQKQKLLM